jgi:hypothetical protein
MFYDEFSLVTFENKNIQDHNVIYFMLILISIQNFYLKNSQKKSSKIIPNALLKFSISHSSNFSTKLICKVFKNLFEWNETNNSFVSLF